MFRFQFNSTESIHFFVFHCIYRVNRMSLFTIQIFERAVIIDCDIKNRFVFLSLVTYLHPGATGDKKKEFHCKESMA